MNFLDILIQFFLLTSGIITLYGSYHEDDLRQRERRFFGFSSKQLITIGGAMTIILTVINSTKDTIDSGQLEDIVKENARLSKKIDSVTTTNMEMTSTATKLAQLNYKLSNISLMKADTLIDKADRITSKAQDIIDISTGGSSFCVIDYIPLVGADTAFRHIANIGNYPLKNLTIYAQQKEENWSYNTNTIIDFVKTIGTLYPGKLMKTLDMDYKMMMTNVAENLAGFNFVPTKMSRKKKNVREYIFMADNGFWKERFELFQEAGKWHKHIVVTKGNRTIYDKTYIFQYRKS